MSNSTTDESYQINASDHAVTKLVLHPFDGSKFGAWKKGMLIALSAKNKLGFIDGTIPKPNSSSPNSRLWQRNNDLVFSWILNSLSEEIASSILYSNTAQEAWEELEARYGQINGAQLYNVQKKLSEFSQGNEDITGYFTKLKMLWDELDSMSMHPKCSCACTCGGKEKDQKFEQDKKIVQLLMGLNESFAVTRGTILLQKPLPKLSTVYNNLLQDEDQKEVKHTPHFQPESASFYAKNSKFSRGNAPNSAASSSTSGGFNNGSSGGSQQRPFNNDTRRSPYFCNFCKKPGHTIDRCYRLQNSKNKKGANNVQTCYEGILGPYDANDQKEVSDNSEIDPALYQQLVQLLKNVQKGADQFTPSSSNFAAFYGK